MCSLFLFLPLYFARPFLVGASVIIEYDVNASCEVRRFLFSKSRSFEQKMVGTLNMKTLEFQRPGFAKSGRKKRNSHTHQLNNGRKYILSLSLSLFSLARWVQKISQKMNVDAFTRLYLRAMSVCARVCTAKFFLRKIYFLGRGKNLRVKKIALARSRVHTHRREDSWDLN